MLDNGDWTDDQWSKFKKWLETQLDKEIIEIVFTKADGSIRVMKATKNTEYWSQDSSSTVVENTDNSTANQIGGVPKRRRPAPSEAAKRENILVWDTESHDWRTIKVKRIKNLLSLLLKYDGDYLALKDS